MAKKRRTIGMAATVDRNWQAESDLRTLLDACKIRKDKKRFAAAQAVAKQQLLEVAAVASENETAKEGADDYKP